MIPTNSLGRLAALNAHKADAPFISWLELKAGETVDSRIHPGTAPEATGWPRVTIDTPTSRGQSFVGFPGEEGVDYWHYWHKSRDESHALYGAEQGKRILHKKKLTLEGASAGLTMWTGTAIIIGGGVDEVTGGTQVILEYTYGIVKT